MECLKAAVQNGANSVYLGASNFNARARAKNFDLETLKEAIIYAKIRNVKVHVTLNILIKNQEFEDAVKLAIELYNLGADALIIQDLGLLDYLLKNYPEIPIHSSTQMTTHNLSGVKQLEKMGVSRVVLSRELSINEIKNICENTNVEIETFIHGALCICYSGQCLFSSIIGGRSGNRGLCAQPCRLPYTLIDEDNNILDKGYLLSPRDLNAINYLPELIRSGVSCFKIEGRLKSPEYVGIITRFYRKYIDIVCDNPSLSNDDLLNMISKEMNKINTKTNMTDLEEITQAFNRGGFSEGHLSNLPNKKLIFKEKPNNYGFYLGKIQKLNSNKGYITLKANIPISIGDKIGIDSNTYTISELMINGNNIREVKPNDIITIGRVKGDININQEVYKIQSKILNDDISPTFKEDKEFRKQKLDCKIYAHKNEPINIQVFCTDKDSIYFNENILVSSNIIPDEAKNTPTTKEKIIEQISKTGNTPFEFEHIDVDVEKNLFIPVSILNELRRSALENLKQKIIDKEILSINLSLKSNTFESYNKESSYNSNKDPEINLLLNILNKDFNYSNIHSINKLYIPLKYFLLSEFKSIIDNICNKFNTYIYMPNILRDNIKIDFDNIVNTFNLKGFVISAINQIDILKKYNLELLGNYTLNVYNIYTIQTLNNLGINQICITPELNNEDTKNLISSSQVPLELMIYGRIPFMTMNYCLLGNSNKCYKECTHLCTKPQKFYIKDRLGLDFRIVPDNSSTITTIYNSKITSFCPDEFNCKTLRVSILDENIDEIQNIIDTLISSKKFEGKEFCRSF
ncbi:MAG: U32 family peptidase [Clostridia bacterium]|nr:U32 family peptidase [Clostridia bacterium]